MDSQAWHNPTWVLAVMHYPSAAALHDEIRGGAITRIAMAEHERVEHAKAAKRGTVAGHVLMVLYAMSTWKDKSAGLARAIHSIERFGYEERFADGKPMPRGRTEIRDCFDAMRPVAHLWAALRLHRQYPTMPHEAILTDAGIYTLLRIARGVQEFALAWRPSRTRSHTELLTKTPWLVPDDIHPLFPPWGKDRNADPPDWLVKTMTIYRRKPR